MGSFRSEPDLTKETYVMSSRDHSYAISHMCGWRKFMEDACLCVSPFTYKNYSLFGVFDGHGGPEVALFTKNHYAEVLQKNDNLKKGNFQLALKESFLQIDELLLSKEGQKQLELMHEEQVKKQNSSEEWNANRVGCTALVILVTKADIYIANSGDCRAVCVSYSGKTESLSRDHKPTVPEEQARIKKAGGYVNYGRVNGCLNLTRAFGDLDFKKNKTLKAEEQVITADPEIKKISKDDLYFIMIGCDGIWECKEESELMNWVKARLDKRRDLGKTLQELLNQIVGKTMKSETGTDNMSTILIKFDRLK